MKTIERCDTGWLIRGGGLVVELNRRTGCLAKLTIGNGKGFEWTHHGGDVTVRDDRLKRTLGREDLEQVRCAVRENALCVEKHFKGAPWRLEETYRADRDAIRWEAQVTLARGDFRSCEVSYRIAWPQPLYPMQFWAAREGMPSAPHRFANIALEYGEITSGILIPALVAYRADQDAGLLLAMPFDFKTPRFRFISAYREPDLQASFDWLALAPGRPARTSLLMRGTGGTWRPALGWLHERYSEYFEPRSSLINDLWGGHTGGSPDISPAQARTMARLGTRWHELHGHFPHYGEYHPEGLDKWEPVHQLTNWPELHNVTVEMVRNSLRNLHKVGIAGFPYIQVTGDGNVKCLGQIYANSQVRDWHGDPIGDDVNCQYNSDPALSFGKDMTRQIDGMVKRYPEMDGVFLDQGCYNFADTAHDDGITAINNRPCYMTGLNYYPHLERLSQLLHPRKAILANGPHCIGIMKYIDGFMAEHWGWLCDLLKWYSLSKPMFFFLYNTGDRDVELMFQRCLVHAAGYTSFPSALPSKQIYDKYRPLVHRLFRRRWVFDPDPIALPAGVSGNVFRGPTGNLLAGMASDANRLRGRRVGGCGVMVKTADTSRVTQVTLQQPGGKIAKIPFTKDKGAVQFDVPGDLVAAVAELHMGKSGGGRAAWKMGSAKRAGAAFGQW
ncbi:MAG: hypothetical protein PHR35_08260 [Kiritimatiellae bacterium]|nr:hypothetical protein [Kiritimatiellia bacterium]